MSRTPGTIRAELVTHYRAAWRLLRELPAECHRPPDIDMYESLKRLGSQLTALGAPEPNDRRESIAGHGPERKTPENAKTEE
jgi:hypothetical protein